MSSRASDPFSVRVLRPRVVRVTGREYGTFKSMKNTSRSRLIFSGVIALALSLSACSNMSNSVKEQADMKTIQYSAESIDTGLNMRAGFGTKTDPNDTAPNRVTLLLEAAIDDPFFAMSTAGTALAHDQIRVLMWQGAGQASVKWTRISCPFGDCSSINPDDGTLVSSTGENSKLYNPEPRASVCLQFHGYGKNVWMHVSSSWKAKSLISDVLETACPASVFPGITAATGTTYADLSATPGEALVDPTW